MIVSCTVPPRIGIAIALKRHSRPEFKIRDSCWRAAVCYSAESGVKGIAGLCHCVRTMLNHASRFFHIRCLGGLSGTKGCNCVGAADGR